MTPRLSQRVVAEGVGTALLLATVAGSGIMAERLSAGNVALALLANAIASGCVLTALILTLAPISGAHFNPVVTIVSAAQSSVRWRDVVPYLFAQFAGAILGVVVAHLMFALPAVSVSQHERAGLAQWISESVATFGLLAIILGRARQRSDLTAFAVGAYIVGAYWFTASTSFANPAVTVARALTDTFAGIRPADVVGFVAAQCFGAAAALFLFRWLVPISTSTEGQAHV